MNNEEKVRGMLQGLAEHIAGEIPPDHGFALLVFTLGEGGTTQYVANCNRLDILQAMREAIAVLGEERHFQRDIGDEGKEEFEEWWSQQLQRFSGRTDDGSIMKQLAYDAFAAGRSTA